MIEYSTIFFCTMLALIEFSLAWNTIVPWRTAFRDTALMCIVYATLQVLGR